MRKKAHALFLSVCLALSLAVPAQAANTELAINAPDELPDVGEKFAVTVDISNNPGIAAAEFTLTFDDNVVECVQVVMGASFAGMLSAANPKADEGAMLAAVSTTEQTKDGTLATYVFRVLSNDDAEFGIKNIQLSDEKGRELSV